MKAEAPDGVGRVLLLVEEAEEPAAASALLPDGLVVAAPRLTGKGAPGPAIPLWVRIGPLAAGTAEGELDAAIAAGAAGILAVGIGTIAEVERLGAKLAVREAEHGLRAGSVRILAAFGDNPAGILATERLRSGRLPRLAGLVFDPESLAEALCCRPDAPAIAAAEVRLILAAAACRLSPVMMLPAGTPASETARAARQAGMATVIARNGAALRAIRQAIAD